MGSTILSMPEDLLYDDPKLMRMMTDAEKLVEECPLKFFVPQNDTVLQFLNAGAAYGVKMFRSGNGVGKSVAAWTDIQLDIIPCDPSWPIFSVHGVRYRKYRRPFTDGGVGIVTYEWVNHKSTIWPQIIQRWTPPEFLGAYRRGGESTPNWNSNPHIEIAGSPIWFFACSQADTVFEAAAMDRFWWDEQGQEQKFNGANARIRRRNGRHVFSLTAHRLDGRPDTGAGSWIQKIETGELSTGHKVKVFHCGISDIPDWIYSERAKKEANDEWIDGPLRTGNMKKYREGLSRINGEYHESSGLVFDDWNRETHVVDRFEVDNSWTRFRGIDHGRVNPTACVFLALDSEDNLVVFDEYYEKDRVASENAQKIIEKSGNRREKVGFGEVNGQKYDRWTEIQDKPYHRTVMDPRSCSKKDDNSYRTIERIYRDEGLAVYPGSGHRMEITIPVAKELFRCDPERPFPKWHQRAGEMGAPRCFVMRHCKWFIWEIEQYINEMVRVKGRGGEVMGERPRSKNDHLMTAFTYIAQEKLRWIPNSTVDEEDEEVVEKVMVDELTGY